MVIDAVRWFLERVAEYSLSAVSSWEQFAATIGQIPRVFVNPSNGLAWPYLLSSLAFAWGMYVVAQRTGRLAGESFWAFAFPARLYRHRSTRLDFRFAAIDIVLTFLFYVPIMTGLGMLGAKGMSWLLAGLLGWEPPRSLSPTAIVIAAIGFLLLHDLINYWAHVLFHKVPGLWAFHRVHHSAEVLTPAAAYRVHPVEIIGFALLQVPAVGFSAVFYENILGRELQVAMIFVVSIVGFAIALMGMHLRHSHIWLSYGPVFNRLFISPAHHQIHHSVDPRHWNKNFGSKLSIWDGLFGTHYRPEHPEILQVGLLDAEPREFETVWSLYTNPLGRSLRTLTRLLEGRT